MNNIILEEYELWAQNIVGDVDVGMLPILSQANQFGT